MHAMGAFESLQVLSVFGNKHQIHDLVKQRSTYINKYINLIRKQLCVRVGIKSLIRYSAEQ